MMELLTPLTSLDIEHFLKQINLTLHSSSLQYTLATISITAVAMVAALWNYFGSKASPKVEPGNIDDESKAIRALPASWYTSQEMYELERRAIFSRKWILVTHSLRLKKTGDFLRYETAGFQFILCRDKDGKINGFHNVCRHRAYPVVTEAKGTAKIFSCKYHGWSYGLGGNLAKAPGFQDLENFDKSQNGLLPIHVHIDNNGFVWVNLDAKKTPEIPWEEDYNGVDKQQRLARYNYDDYEFDHEWEMTGDYNWKILADNYNECYHCATTHPDLLAMADLHAYSVTPQDAYIRHNVQAREAGQEAGWEVAPTYFYPSTSMNVSFVPHGPTKSTMRYEVYRNKNSTEEEFQVINQMYKRVMSEDKALCELAQRNVAAGVFINGEMHPRMEKGPLFFQGLCRDLVMDFHKREQAAKQEIWPARQSLPGKAAVSQQDIDFCSGLACSSVSQEALAW